MKISVSMPRLVAPPGRAARTAPRKLLARLERAGVRELCEAASSVRLLEVLGPSQERAVVRARHAVWAALSRAGLSRADIATLFERDICAIRYGLQKAGVSPREPARPPRAGAPRPPRACRPPAAAPPSPEEPRRAGFLPVVGRGERREDCALYAECLRRAYRDPRLERGARCPAVCLDYRPRDRSVELCELACGQAPDFAA